MTDDEPGQVEYGLLYPFVVCATNGGPYDDSSFVAGAWFGKVSAECKKIAPGGEDRWYVPSPLVPQLDLLAMHEKLEITAEPWDEYPDEWTLVIMRRSVSS